MATKVRLDALEDQKLDQQGDSLANKTQKEIASRLILEAETALPKGMPANSPYLKYGRDELLSEAARLDMRFGPFLEIEDLRLVVEHNRQKLITLGAPTLVDPAPPVPHHVAPKVKIRGLKESPTDTWVVRDAREKPPLISVGGGQMARLRNGSILELRHYSPVILQGIVDQGITLIPIEDDKDRD